VEAVRLKIVLPRRGISRDPGSTFSQKRALNKHISPHPNLLPIGEKGFFLLSSREERTEVRRDIKLKRVMQ